MAIIPPKERLYNLGEKVFQLNNAVLEQIFCRYLRTYFYGSSCSIHDFFKLYVWSREDIEKILCYSISEIELHITTGRFKYIVSNLSSDGREYFDKFVLGYTYLCREEEAYRNKIIATRLQEGQVVYTGEPIPYNHRIATGSYGINSRGEKFHIEQPIYYNCGTGVEQTKSTKQNTKTTNPDLEKIVSYYYCKSLKRKS